MQSSSIYLIAIAEIAACLLLVCVFLVFQNRSLKGLVSKLQARMEQLVKDLKAARAAAKSRKADDSKTTDSHNDSYKQMLNKQLGMIREHHQRLDASQDIALDLDPETPLPRRVAALRYALLQAEKEATANKLIDHADWKLLQTRYEQIFDFHRDYAPKAAEAPAAQETAIHDTEQLDSLREELTSAKKRISNLERFKALYFDLEAKWESCKDNARSHYNEITELAAKTDHSEAIETALMAYQSNYSDLGALIEGGIEGSSILQSKASNEDSSSEIRHLRAVAADQHKIINELQRKLRTASSAEEKEIIVGELQDQLQKQIRFVQESETCIQLLEDELSTSHKELEQLRARLNQLPQLKTDIVTLRDQNDDYEMQITATKSENRRLQSRMKELESAPPGDNDQARKLKKELIELESRYVELEEKFLDLKLGQ
ncbi:hypothetical protein [Teredinibacter haidensis]|uniref:hypothetical protein n=1 Tax=Teredinibacter haidensis TaxID=2731755 RepID=UPI000948FEF4|nr:hypothetical protein [Teredinibacter haidensis]